MLSLAQATARVDRIRHCFRVLKAPLQSLQPRRNTCKGRPQHKVLDGLGRYGRLGAAFFAEAKHFFEL